MIYIVVVAWERDDDPAGKARERFLECWGSNIGGGWLKFGWDPPGSGGDLWEFVFWGFLLFVNRFKRFKCLRGRRVGGYLSLEI